MAKDPATLWYWNDWNSGTVLLSRFLKGCYMDLLHAQFNHGRLSLEEIKICLGSDFGTSWPALQKKFKQDEKGLFFNERAEQEKIKRQEFVKSRANGKSGRKKSYDKSHDSHTNNHTEDENENRNVNDFKEGGLGEIVVLPISGFWSDSVDKNKQLTDVQLGATVEFIRIKTKKQLLPSEVTDHWQAFKIQQLNKHEWYNSFEDLLSHFRNSLKLELNGTHKNNNGKSVGKSAGAQQLLASLKDDIKAAGI